MKQATRKPTTAGEVLLYEYLEPLDLKINDLAEMLNVHRNTVSALVNNNRKLTPDMAFRLAVVFDTTPTFWLNFQNSVDVWEIENDARTQEEISRVTPVKVFLADKKMQVNQLA
ncbi:HigA family addiction module antitoxin [Pantoea sp. FN060301]|uniref:HigA family addiction module antitoxin n=1 Tax=Pantoea sp. FN060301 TaxID=3420380 RepID=UPI003D17EE99